MKQYAREAKAGNATGRRGEGRLVGRKKMAAPTEIDLDAVAAMRERIATISNIPEPARTDLELGLKEINRIIPDSWHNIPHVVTHALTAVSERVYHQAKLLEGVKEYAIAQNQLTCQNFIQSLE